MFTFSTIERVGNPTPICTKRVKCISNYKNDWGNCAPIKGNLKVGETYEVERTEVHTWHTRLWLKGYERPFNSVHFEEVE